MADVEGMENIPSAVATRRVHRTVWIFWLVPLAAVAIGIWLGLHSVLERGPTLTIKFRSADGIDAAKTKIRFKDVEIGEVKSIGLTPDYRRVVVTAELKKPFSKLLVKDTRFWVVRPRIAAQGVSGLNTLLSGSYIGVDIGHALDARDEFDGLEVPPVITQDLPGREFRLHGQDLGSLDVGSPVYYRRVAVGQVTAFDLDPDGRGVSFKIFVNAPYDKYVSADTRYWHASGVDITVDANGLRLDTQSLSTIVLGGVAFETPPTPDRAEAPEAAADTVFRLSANRMQAMRTPDTGGTEYVMLFKGSVRGLSVGAPVDFRGVTLGEVTDIRVDLDDPNQDVDMAVTARIYPDRLRSTLRKAESGDEPERERKLVDAMVARGFRAQLRNGNLLTGQMFVALDFFPEAAAAHVAWNRSPAAFPTVRGTFDTLQESVASLVTKLDRVPIDAIGRDLQRAVQHLDNATRHADALLAHADNDILPEVKVSVRQLGRAAQHTDELVARLGSEVTPALSATIADTRRMLDAAARALTSASGALDTNSPLQIDARKALLEISTAARAMRGLGDYLERHPESVVRGKAREAR